MFPGYRSCLADRPTPVHRFNRRAGNEDMTEFLNAEKNPKLLNDYIEKCKKIDKIKEIVYEVEDVIRELSAWLGTVNWHI